MVLEVSAQKKEKRGRYKVTEANWLVLFRVVGRNGQTSYSAGFYRSGKNNYLTRTIGHEEGDAKKTWEALIKGGVPDLGTETEKKSWLCPRIVPLLRRRRSKEINLDFGKNTLADRLRKFCEGYCNKPINRESKTRTVKVCRSLASLAGDNENLTPRVVRAFFASRTNPEKHRSPETLQHEKMTIKMIARYLGMTQRRVDDLFREINLPTKPQLRDQRTEFGEKNRVHLERPQIKSLIEKLIRDTSPEWENERSSLWLQLLTAWRPSETPCAELFDSSISVDGSWKNNRKKSLKTASRGVGKITIARDPYIDAYLYLTKCKPGPMTSARASKYFKRVALDALGDAGKGLDRYCLRHTALTWMARSSIAPRLICDAAGHMSMRMLDAQYANRSPKDQRPWGEAMPLNFKGIPKDWRGFLLECVIAAKWTGLEKGIKPHDAPEFKTLLQILRNADKKRPELDLFD